MRTRTISFFVLIAVLFINFQWKSYATANAFRGENMNLDKISYIQLKIKDKFSKEDKKTEITNKEEIKTIIDGIEHYKEKTLIDLICKYQLSIYGNTNDLIKLYEVGWFIDNKRMVLVRDKSKGEDYVIVGEAAIKIVEYLNRLDSSK